MAACSRELPPQEIVVEERIEWCAAGMFDASLEQVRASQWTLVIREGQAPLPEAESTPRLSELIPDLTDIELEIDLLDAAGGNRIDDGTVSAAIYQGTNESFQVDEAVDLVLVQVPVARPPVGVTDPTKLSFVATTATGEDLRLGQDSELQPWIRCQRPGAPFMCARGFIPCDPGGPTFRTRVVLEGGEVVLDLRNLPGDHDGGVPPSWAFMRAEVRIDDVEVVEDGYDALFFSPKAWDGEDGMYGVLPAAGLGALGCGVVVDLTSEGERAVVVDCELREVAPLEIVALEREML
jgi:hypothetical protein